MDKLIGIIKDLLHEGIPINGVDLLGDGLCFYIDGFAKSGHGTLYERDGVIELKTRYSQIDVVESIEDVIRVAYDWDYNYRDEYKASSAWQNLYNKYGYKL